MDTACTFTTHHKYEGYTACENSTCQDKPWHFSRKDIAREHDRESVTVAAWEKVAVASGLVSGFQRQDPWNCGPS